MRSGTLAGAISAFVFTVVHYVTISDIWFSLPGYALLLRPPSLGSWSRYNLAYLVMFALLGVASVAFAGLERQTLAPGGGA